MNFNIIFYIGALLVVGLLGGQLIRRLKLPSVTGYLVAGLFIGPYVSTIIPLKVIENLGIFSNVALGFIAFSIGSEFKMSYFKRVGMTPIVIAIFEALTAVVFVTLALILAGFDVSFAIMLGAIASATAPAATIMVIKQYKAKGPVTETLLSVVAIDDAVALIAFGLSTAIAQSLMGANDNFILALVKPIMEIIESIGIGAILGIAFIYPLRYLKTDANRLIYTIGCVLIGVGLAETFHISALLLCMSFGAIFTNFYNDSDRIMNIAEGYTPPLLLIFFVLSGAELNPRVFFSSPEILMCGAIYIVVRVVGKIAGASIGAKLMHASDKISTWLGPALIPQAGVAIGLSLVAESVVPSHGTTIRAVILCATLIYELIGPVVTKYSLTKAGEIIGED